MMLFVVKLVIWLIASYFVFSIAASVAPWLPFVKGRADSGVPAPDALAFPTDTSCEDSVLLVERPQDAYAIRIAMLRGARETLDIVYYTIQADDSGKAFLGEVLCAAERGVRVRILLDGTINATGGIKGLLGSLQTHPNITCRLYNPIHPLQPWRWHALLHDKLLLVDGTHLLSGGRNVGNRFFALHGYTGTVTYDREVFVTRAEAAVSNPAPAANRSVLPSAARHIDSLWNHEASRPHKADKRPGPWLDTLRACMGAIEKDNAACYAHDLDRYIRKALPARKVTLISNPIHTRKKDPLVGKALHTLAVQAKHSVIIQTPYSTGTKVILRALADIDASTETIMLTNSAASSPNVFAFSDYYRARRAFYQTGVDIYELQRKDSMHGKSMVVDYHLSAVGSLNLDDRSLFIDTENMLVIDSEPFASALRLSMEIYKSASLQIGPEGGYLPASTKALPVSRMKRVMMTIVPVLLRPFRFLL